MALPEGAPVQLINNHIVMSPAPNVPHQRLIARVANAIEQATHDRGETIFAPVDVHLDNENVVQPDVLFVSNDNADIIHEDAIYGSPDIAVEVLSTKRTLDLVKKRDVYERFQIPEYFVVDPKTRVVTTFYLINGRYEEQAPRLGVLKSRLFEVTF